MKRMFWLAAVVLALVGLAALVGCSGGYSTHPQVRITRSGFSPAKVTIKAGDTVTWINDGDTLHTVTYEGPLSDQFDSAAIPKGASFSHKFDQAGSYVYSCRYHVTETGNVTVR